MGSRLHVRWGNQPHVITPNWGPPPSCKQALRETEDNYAYAKFWSDQQSVLWYFLVFSVVVNYKSWFTWDNSQTEILVMEYCRLSPKNCKSSSVLWQIYLEKSTVLTNLTPLDAMTLYRALKDVGSSAAKWNATVLEFCSRGPSVD